MVWRSHGLALGARGLPDPLRSYPNTNIRSYVQVCFGLNLALILFSKSDLYFFGYFDPVEIKHYHLKTNT